ncbi:hypothetical protein JCM19231_2499 [Vibrio ishigakensis]|uniref:Sulfotransferase family protein n=1 Tax=Vibrio ishigakensis TaxID=1481914 RepID=A0A0B8NNS4_9VIBR|nr:hypothetical protein [Vibrio ishigakensis]GAM56245.1 hypothetical protein JCM19231_2499 [Vibrio ishigakensis]
MEIENFKVYGERNTATNYLIKLLSINFPRINILRSTVDPSVLPKNVNLPASDREKLIDNYFESSFSSNLGWKHSFICSDKLRKHKEILSKTLIITITKNPYSWLLSFYRKPYHRLNDYYDDFRGFLKPEWRTVGRDGLDDLYLSPIEIWNLKNRSYVDCEVGNVLNIKSENLIINPKVELDRISQAVFNRDCEIFCNYFRSTKSDKKDSEYYKSYYKNEIWKKEIKREDIKYITERLDFSLMKKLRYDEI